MNKINKIPHLGSLKISSHFAKPRTNATYFSLLHVVFGIVIAEEQLRLYNGIDSPGEFSPESKYGIKNSQTHLFFLRP